MIFAFTIRRGLDHWQTHEITATLCAFGRYTEVVFGRYPRRGPTVVAWWRRL